MPAMDIDLEAWIQPRPGPNPCGPNLERTDDFILLMAAASGIPAVGGVGDATTKAVPPDWNKVAAAAPPLLAQTRDLRLAVVWCMATTFGAGLAGLASGLSLIRGLVAQHWNSGLHPVSDADNPWGRQEELDRLLDVDMFAGLLDAVPVIQSRIIGDLSVIRVARILTSEAGQDGVTPIAINRAFEEVSGSRDLLLDQIHDVLVALSSLRRQLQDLLDVKQLPFASFADWLGGLKNALSGASPVLADMALRSAAAGAFAGGPITTMSDVRSALDAIITYYKLREPSSPVPVLLTRARRLVGANFEAVLEDLLPDAARAFEKLSGVKAQS